MHLFKGLLGRSLPAGSVLAFLFPAAGWATGLTLDPFFSSERLPASESSVPPPLPVGVESRELGQGSVPPEVWQVVGSFDRRTTGEGCTRDLLQPVGLEFDPQNRLVLGWVAFGGCGSGGAGAWARREGETWQVSALNQVPSSSSFSIFDPNGGMTLTLSSNGVPYAFFPGADFGGDQPFYLLRANLETNPNGPGVAVHSFLGGRAPDTAFAANGRASDPPTFLTHTPGSSLRINGAIPISHDPLSGGLAGELVFRQGPSGRNHVLYEKADQLRYNGGSPDQEADILRINTGSQHTHDLAVGPDDAVHVSAAQGTGRFFFGAVGRLVYLHSRDGRNWSTNLLSPQEDVGATAIAVDSHGLPGIAFTRGYDSLYFLRQSAGGQWGQPVRLRTGLGGWERSKVVRLAFDRNDVPHVAVYDHPSGRVLVLAPVVDPEPVDLAVEVQVATNRLAVGTATNLVVTAINASGRDATSARLRLRFPAEIVVRDFVPRPSAFEGSEYVFELGTLQALEQRVVRFEVGALDPVRLCVETDLTSDVDDLGPEDNHGVDCVAEFVPAACLVANPAGDCAKPRVLPEVLPPVIAGQPWSVNLRVPTAPAGAELRFAGALPPGWCFTADGQLRGLTADAGASPLRLEVVSSDGSVTAFERSLRADSAGLPKDLLAFWPLDGDLRDVVSGDPAPANHRVGFLPGVVGSAAQTTRNLLEDPLVPLRDPPAMLVSPVLRQGAAIGTNALTLTGWFRRDGGGGGRGTDRRAYGTVFGLVDQDVWGRERFVLFDPTTSRLNLVSGPPDARSTPLLGPVLAANTWHHLALVCESTRVRLFVNGALAVEGSFPAPLVERPRVIAGAYGNGAQFTGALDEIALYGRALSAEQLVTLARNPLPRPAATAEGGEFPLAALAKELALPDAAEGESYRASLSAAFCGSPHAFAVIDGRFPAGLVLDADGQWTGAPKEAGSFWVRVRAQDKGGHRAELEVLLTVKPSPPRFAKEPEDQQVELGGLLVLVAETLRPASLQWYYNGEPIPGEIRPLLTIPEFSSTQAGLYQVLAENAGGTLWSRAASVGVRAAPPGVDRPGVSGVERRADGVIRLRLATLRGRVYELQRALDLNQALRGGWEILQRFVAVTDVAELADVIAGRPDAAFYRLVERPESAPAPFSLLDTSRFVGLAADGQPREGLLPLQDTQTGRLGPMDYRIGGGEVPLDEGLMLRLGQGAQPVVRDGATVLQFRTGELSFGEESPVQLDEGGTNRVVFTAPSDRELAAGPVSVEVLERLLGKPAGSGIGLTFFKHFHFQLLAGTFDGNRIRAARMAWADRSRSLPTPERSGNYLDFDIDLSATRLRLPFHGEFTLEDGTSSAAKLTVSKAAPIVVEMRPGPELSLSGRANVRFANGPEFEIELRLDEPVFKGAILAKRLRLPEGLSLRQWIGTLPPLVPVEAAAAASSAPSVANFLPDAPVPQAGLLVIDGELLKLARAHCSGSTMAFALLRGAFGEERLFERPGLESTDDVIERTDVTDHSLAEVRAWRCVVEAADGVEALTPVAGGLLRNALKRAINSGPEDMGPIIPRGAEIGPMTYAYRAGVLAEVALAAQAGRQTEPNPILQPLVDRAYEAFAAARDADASEWDSTTLLVASRNLARVRAVAIQNPTILSEVRDRELRETFERLARLRGTAFQRELLVRDGDFRPDNNTAIAPLHRWEAMARLRQAMRLNAAAEIAGAVQGSDDPVNNETLSQLAHQSWKQIERIVRRATNGCTAVGFQTALAAAPEIAEIARIAEQLSLRGISVELPVYADANRFLRDIEERCANQDPPVEIDQLLHATPENLLARCEAHLALLGSVPVSLRDASPEVSAALAGLRASLDEILVKRHLLLRLFAPKQLLQLLRVGLRHDQLRRRFALATEPDWLSARLPAIRENLERVAREEKDPRFLVHMNELLLQAAQRRQDDAPPTPAPTRRSSLHAGPSSPPETAEDRQARIAYYHAAHAGISVAQELLQELAADLEQPVIDPIGHLADLRLPGGLTVENAFGELAYHTRLRQISGAFGGDLQIPGAGLRLTLKRAEFASGGAFAAELFGSLALPPAQPLATFSIPPQQPARLRLERGQPPRLSGGGRLRLANGATLDAFVSLEDPVYRFTASASSLRFSLTTNLVQRAGLSLANVAGDTTGLGLEYLTRVGLLLDPLQPEAAPPADLEPLRKEQVRPLPSDSDDAAATGAALRLLVTDRPGAGVSRADEAVDSVARRLHAVPALPQLHALTAADLSNGVALVQQFLPALDRAANLLVTDAESLTGLDQALLFNATPVDPADVASLRGPKLVEVARRLGLFGSDYQDVLVALRTERGRQILGAANVPSLEEAFRPFVENYHRCLLALRTNLLVLDPRPNADPWRVGPDWNADAATAAIEAVLRFEQVLQQIGGTDPALSTSALNLGCSFLQNLIGERLAELGLDSATGNLPTTGGALATYLALSRADAELGLRRLLVLSSWVQGAGLCGSANEPRLTQGIAGIALRLRDLVAEDLRRALASTSGKAWEPPEQLLAFATNLAPVITLPQSLGINRYPASTERLRPTAAQPTTDDPRVDATDLFELLTDAAGRLALLVADEGSGYPAELRRRRRAALLPPAGILRDLVQRYGNAPGLGTFRQHLERLAQEEARLLVGELNSASFPAEVARDAAGFVRRVLNLARILDDASAPSSSTLSSPSPSSLRGQANVTALRSLVDSVLPRFGTLLAADTSQPWWVSAMVARELVGDPQGSWQTAGVTEGIQGQRMVLQILTRDRVQALTTSLVARLAADLPLPGEVEVRRIFGGLVLNRETHFVLFEVGGRLEFPQARTVGGQPAFVELQRLRLESNGRFAFEAATRTPLPFAEATFAGSFRASGDLPHRAIALGGEGTLTFAAAPRDPGTGQNLPTTVSASVAYEPIGYDAQGAPEGWRFAFQSGGTFQRSFGPHFAVFGASAGLVVGQNASGQPIGGVNVGGSVGLFRKSDRLASDPPLPTDFQVVVENARVEINGTVGQGGTAALTGGVAKLPDFFYSADLPPDLQCDPNGTPRTGASVAIRTPIRLSYEVDGKPRLEGSLRFSHFGARIPKAEFLSFVICQADLGLDDQGLPFLDIARAGMVLDIPWDRGAVRLQNLHLGLDGKIRGELFLTEDFDLVKASDFRASLLGVPSLSNPAERPPDGCRGTALILEDVPGTPVPRVTLLGGVKVTLPSSLIAMTNGASVAGFFCGGIRIEPTAGGPVASAFINELGFEGDFGMGQRAFALKRAKISAGNFEGILQPNPERPFHLSISGDLQTGPFTFGLTNAQLRYLGLDRPPGFSIEALGFARDAMQPLPVPLSFLPFAVDFAEFRFKSPLAPIQTLFQPTNVQVTISGRVGLPTVQYAFVRGGVAGLQFNFAEDGTPIPPPIDGFDLEISSTAELKMPLVGDFGGKLRFGGFRRALTNGPAHLYAVGQLGGTSQGFRLSLLSAFNLVGPIGMCLDVNLGGAGLVLAPTPFQITGASGGFAFLTTDNPCDFTQYFVFDPNTGSYQLKQSVELPSIPTGMSWDQFTKVVQDMTDRAEAYAANFDPGTIPLPGAPAGNRGSRTESRLQPAGIGQAEVVETATPGGRGSAPATSGDVFGCPTNCPPATVAIVCQPHPDQARFANRIIFKFSSIPESVLTNARPNGLGITRSTLGELGADAGAIASRVADRLVEVLAGTFSPGGSGLTPVKVSFLAQQQQRALAGVHTVAASLVDAALRASPDAYAAIRDVLYAGIPCPDLSLALAGRVSMVGLSGFGWVEGREASSLSGSGGVVGELYALGVPLGQARVFVASTDANGDPNPSLCGQVTSSFGPLDLGRVDLAMRCEGCVTELLRLFPTLAHALGEPFLTEALNRVAPAYASFAGDPAALLRELRRRGDAEQLRVMLGLFTEAQNAGPAVLPGNLAETLRAAVADTWSRIDPRLTVCGEIQPRLFGLPLTLGGRLAAMNLLADKQGLLGEFAFSPSALVPLFPPGDEAAMSFSLRVRDPYQSLLNGFDGTFGDPVRLQAFLRDQANYALENHVVAAQYQWHPFGLELGDAAVRVLLPYFLDHPAFPGSAWVNPDERRDSGLPTRDAVLVQAAASGKLGSAFAWLGTTNDFASIFASGDARGDQLRAQGLELRRDYFPHGGIVGGARMALPRMLMANPAEWQPLYQQAVHGTNLFEQLEAALTLLDEYVLRNETNGTAAFYVPAPNPPVLYASNGQPLTAAEVRRALVERPAEFTADALLRQLRALDLRDPQTLARLYPDSLSFLRAEMTNLTILGTPVFGTATITGRPTPMRLLDGAPLAHLQFDIAGNSPVGRLAGGGFEFGFDLYSIPEQSLAIWGRDLATELRRQRNGEAQGVAGDARALASVPATTTALQRFTTGITRQLPRFATTNTLPSVSFSDPRDWAGAGVGATRASGSIGGIGALSGKIGKVAPWLRAELQLRAFSPFYDPATPGDGPLEAARREGGLAVAGSLEFFPGTAGRAGSGILEASVTASGSQPRLRGRVRGLNLPTPFVGFAVQNARAEFDNQANPFLRASLTGFEIPYGNFFSLVSASGQPGLSADLTLGTSVGLGGLPLPQTRLELAPVRLTGNRLGGRTLLVHGAAGATSPVVVSETRWEARASFVSSAVLQGNSPEIVLRANLAGALRDVVKFTGLPASPFAFDGQGLTQFHLRLTSPPPAALTLEIFPGLAVPGLSTKTLRLRPALGTSLDLRVNSDGTFRLVGKLEEAFNSGPSGIFGLDADVRVDETGVTISGQVGASTGTLTVGSVDNRIVSQFSGQLVLPRLVALGGRVTLAAPDGGDLSANVGPNGTCVSGAVLTLQDFAPGAAPVRFTFPAFCLDANGNFQDLLPTAAASGVSLASVPSAAALASRDGLDLAVVGRPTLPVGAFRLEGLGSARLSGGFTTRGVSLAFDAQLGLGSLLSLPIRGSVGSAGLVVTNAAANLRLLGLDFSTVRLGATNTAGDLPGVSFAGRLPVLPVPFRDLDFVGAIPDTGDFTLTPAGGLNLPAFLPGFALEQLLPSVAYRTAPYAEVVRADAPSGYWPLENVGGKIEDQRLAKFGIGQIRRNGTLEGAVPPAQAGPITPATGQALTFDGTTSRIRLPAEVLSSAPEAFSVSLWFRRAPGRFGVVGIATAPQTLAGRGSQWSLRLLGTTATGTRLNWNLDGLQNFAAAPLPALSGRTRLDDAEWHHVVAVFDGAAQYLYLDGRLDAWQATRGKVTSLAGTELVLAARQVGASLGEFFSGALDEVAIFPLALGPQDALGQWMAAGGRAGVTLTGRLPTDVIPGLAATQLDGVLATNGSVVLEFANAGQAEFAGVRLPSFRANLVRSGDVATLAYRSSLTLPVLDAGSLGSAHGVFGSDGVFQLSSGTLLDRGVFGWDLRLTNVVASGNWVQRQVSATAGGRVRLPYQIAELEVGGSLNTAAGGFNLRGRAEGTLPLGTRRLTINSAPELGADLLKIPGQLALGAALDAASFGTSLEIRRSGDVTATFQGTTGWIEIPGSVAGQLKWNGRLAYVNAYPELTFTGTFALSWPGHPASLDDLQSGLHDRYRRECWRNFSGFELCNDVLDGLSLKSEVSSLLPNARGELAIPVEPSFRGIHSVSFRIP